MSFDWQAELAPLAATALSPRLISPQVTAPPVQQASAPSFAQVLTSSASSLPDEVPLPQPLIKGEQLSIRISQPIYEKGVDYCNKRNLRGRLILNKGDKPYTSIEIHQRLQKHWNTAAPWSLLSLGRGYYEFFFASEADMRSVWAKGTTILKPGILGLFEWRKDFNMHKQKNTHAQVWIHLIELPQEYWMDRTLREIASAIGTPLTIDNATSKRLYGHYARILVDMDCSKKLFYEILVEREGFSFPVEVVYEWMPDFCTHCHNLGHHVTNCRWLYPKKDVKEPVAPKKDAKETVPKTDKGKTKAPVPKEAWVPMQTNPSGVGSSNAFAALAVTNTEETEPVKDFADNTFSLPLQHVVDHVPQRTLPQLTKPVLTLALNDDELRAEGERILSGSADISPVVSEIPLISNAEQALINDEVTDANLPEQGTRNSKAVDMDGEGSDFENSEENIPVIDVDDTNTVRDEVSTTFEREAGMTHTNPRIQKDHITDEAEVNLSVPVPPVQQHVSKNIQDGLDLWARIREYDQRIADEGFTQVLTKAQKQARKKHVLGTSYQTRAKGPLPSSK